MTMRWLEGSRLQFLGQLTNDQLLMARTTLAAWQSLQGTLAGYTYPPAYGYQPGDLSSSGIWGDRDGWVLASFTNWWNKGGKQPTLPAPGTKKEIAWSGIQYEHAQALNKWAVEQGLSLTPGQIPSTFPSAATKPAGWPDTLPWPPNKPSWWPDGLVWPPIGADWNTPPLGPMPSWWSNAGIPWPPPVPGSSGYPYPWFQWPAGQWPIGQIQTFPFPNIFPITPAPAPVPETPSPTVPGPAPTPGGTPTCDPGFHYDPTSKLCQPNLPITPGPRPTPSETTKSTSSGSTGVLLVVGGLIALGVIGAVIAGGRSTTAAPKKRAA